MRDHNSLFSLIVHVFPRERARARKRERPRTRNVLLCRPIESGMLDYEKLDGYRIALDFGISTYLIR